MGLPLDAVEKRIADGIRAKASRTEARLSFREFVDKVFPRYRWFKHCEVLAEVLQRVADGEIKRLMIFMPPRHGKSELVSRLFSAYWLYLRPHEWVGMVSYGAELAHKLSRASRGYYLESGRLLLTGAAAVKEWETGYGGGLWATGIDGPATGKGWHLGIIDDPIKDAKEASSDIVREGVWDYYGSVFYTREEPNDRDEPDGALIVVQTRWSEEDLAGKLLDAELSEDDPEDAENWVIVDYAAIKEAEEHAFPETCTVIPDWRKTGEALCPERRPLRKLEKIRKRIGDYFFEALFQQNPFPKEGTIFRPDAIETVDVVPDGLRKCRAWDLAATEGDGKFTVGIRMEGPDAQGYYYVVGVYRKQREAGKRNQEIRAVVSADGRSVTQRFPQDPGAAGKAEIHTITVLLAGYPVIGKPVSGEKELRWRPLAAQVNIGMVRMLRGNWNAAFITELRSASNKAKFIDQPDAAADAFDELSCGFVLKIIKPSGS